MEISSNFFPRKVVDTSSRVARSEMSQNVVLDNPILNVGRKNSLQVSRGLGDESWGELGSKPAGSYSIGYLVMFPVFGAPSPSGPRYYCHQCSREVDTYEENEERVCVNCRETFVEELESPVQPPPINPAPSFTSNQNPNPFFPFFQFPSGPGQAPVNGGSNGDQPAFSRIPLLNLSINMDLQSNENRPPFPQILQSLLQSMGANQNGAPPGYVLLHEFV